MNNFVRNSWYVAGWLPEPGHNLFSRTILGESIVFFRQENGAWAGIGNRCPHRFAPLDKGRIVGNALQCGYHGLRFNGAGECVHNSIGKGHVPRAAKVKSYPVVQRHGMLWVWCGEHELASADLIPDFSVLEDPAWAAATGGYIRIQADYQLVVDNLMDLTHVAFLHPMFGQEDMTSPIIDLKEKDREITANYWMANIGTPKAWSELFAPATHIDHWLDMRFFAPSNLLLNVGGTHLGAQREAGVNLFAVHLLTPETSTSVHYFYGAASPLSAGGMAAAQGTLAGQHRAFHDEDGPMLEGCQRMMDGHPFWELKPVLLGADAGAVRARRLIDRLSAAEKSREPAEAEA